MTLTKIDLVNKTFPRALYGYHKAEVDLFLQELAETLGRGAEEKKELLDRLAELTREISGYRERETALGDTLLTTKRIAEDIKSEARREAEGIVLSAGDRAAALLSRAEERLAALEREISGLERGREEFIRRWRALVAAQAELLDTVDRAGEARLDKVGLDAAGGDTAGLDKAGGDEADAAARTDFTFSEGGA